MKTDEILVARLEFESIRKAFASEPRAFTTWLEQNIEALSSRVGIDLTVVKREQEAGPFRADLLCEDAEGNPVIIENQLERTDHSHLGQLLTYLVNLEANVAIWVTPEPRPEHLRVIDWLNESTAENILFYLVKVEVARIGSSAYAPLFTVLARPSVEVKQIGAEKKGWAERQQLYRGFWSRLLERSKGKTELFANRKPGTVEWFAIGAGTAGISFNYVVWKDSAAVELYIDTDQETGEQNKEIFDALKAQRQSIEGEFGEELLWDRLDEKRASRIRKMINSWGIAQPDTWDVLLDDMIGSMIRLHKTLRPRLTKMKSKH